MKIIRLAVSSSAKARSWFAQRGEDRMHDQARDGRGHVDDRSLVPVRQHERYDIAGISAGEHFLCQATSLRLQRCAIKPMAAIDKQHPSGCLQRCAVEGFGQCFSCPQASRIGIGREQRAPHREAGDTSLARLIRRVLGHIGAEGLMAAGRVIRVASALPSTCNRPDCGANWQCSARGRGLVSCR